MRSGSVSDKRCVYQALKRFLLQSCKLTFRVGDTVAGMRCGLNFLDAQLLPYD
jgi:hypothetical protein